MRFTNVLIVTGALALPLTGLSSLLYAESPVQTELTEPAKAEPGTEGEQAAQEESDPPPTEGEMRSNLQDIRARQEQDERSLRVRANLFPSLPPELDCTGADRARGRLEKVVGEGGVVMLGDVLINSENETNVKENRGTITNNVNVNIINEDKRRC